MKLFITSILAFACLSLSAPAAESLKEKLQKGFFEEEANQNIDGAIQAYQSIVAQFEEERKIATSAMFRLAECYRKLGRTNDAVVQYQRVISQGGDETLKRLSEQNLSALGAGGAGLRQAQLMTLPANDEAAQVQALKSLFQNSPDLINAPDESQRTRLHRAAEEGKLLVAEFLLKNGARTDSRANSSSDFGMTALHFAAQKGHKAMVDLLLDYKADINAVSKSNWTPLHYAISRDFNAIAETLMKRGANLEAMARARNMSTSEMNDQPPGSPPSALSGTPLHIAAQRGNGKLVEALLAAHVNVNAKSEFGFTPLFGAVSIVGKEDIALLLLERGAEVNARANDGMTPLHAAMRIEAPGIIALLLKRGADPDLADKEGKTALHRAVEVRSPEVLALLLERSKGVDNASSQGLTPLRLAIAPNNAAFLEKFEMLLKAGADPNGAAEDGNPLLHFCLHLPSYVELLLRHGADPNARDQNGHSALEKLQAGRPPSEGSYAGVTVPGAQQQRPGARVIPSRNPRNASSSSQAAFNSFYESEKLLQQALEKAPPETTKEPAPEPKQ